MSEVQEPITIIEFKQKMYEAQAEINGILRDLEEYAPQIGINVVTYSIPPYDCDRVKIALSCTVNP